MRGIALLALLGTAATPAPAAGGVPVCNEEERTRMTLADPAAEPALPDDEDEAPNNLDEPEAIADEADERQIIPCALVESGAYGPVCLDASGYLITQSGVVLCEVTGPLDEPAFQDEEKVDPSPGQSGVTQPTTVEAAAPAASRHRRGLTARMLGAAALGRALGPGQDHASLKVPPA